jgi:hypothetical protein
VVSTYVGREWSASRSDRVIQGETESRDPWDSDCVGPGVDLDALDTTDDSVANGGDRTHTILMSKPYVMRFHCSAAVWTVGLLFSNQLERTGTVVHDTTKPG